MRAVIVSLLVGINLIASEAEWTRLLLEKMVENLQNSGSHYVYVMDDKIRSYLQNSDRIQLVENCSEANLIIAYDLRHDTSCSRLIPAIVLSYRAFRRSPEAVGAFFWQKGRPTVMYLRPRLEAYNLSVSQKLSKYVVGRL